MMQLHQVAEEGEDESKQDLQVSRKYSAKPLQRPTLVKGLCHFHPTPPCGQQEKAWAVLGIPRALACVETDLKRISEYSKRPANVFVPGHKEGDEKPG